MWQVLTANFEKASGQSGMKCDEAAIQPVETSPTRRRSFLPKGDHQKPGDMQCGKQGSGLMVEGQGKVGNSNEDLLPTTSFGKPAEDLGRSTTKVRGQLNNFGEVSASLQQAQSLMFDCPCDVLLM